MFNIRNPINSLRKNASLAAVAEATLSYSHALKRAHLNVEDRRTENNHARWTDTDLRSESEQLNTAGMEWNNAAQHLYRLAGLDFDAANEQEWERTRAIRAARALRDANGKLTLDLTTLPRNA